jgi:hypothetical protein
MSSTITPYAVQREHLGSIALNNVAVCLLERGCYLQALETMQDAICVMRCVCRPLLSNASNGDPCVEAKIKQATYRMAHPIRTQSTLFDARNLAEQYCRVLHEENSHSKEKEEVIIYPIRIDDVSYEASFPTGFGDIDFESAVSL